MVQCGGPGPQGPTHLGGTVEAHIMACSRWRLKSGYMARMAITWASWCAMSPAVVSREGVDPLRGAGLPLLGLLERVRLRGVGGTASGATLAAAE